MTAAQVVGPPPPSAGPMGRGTLGRSLVLRVAALVTMAAVLLGGASILAAQQLLLNTTDTQLDAVVDRLRNDPRGGLNSPGQPIGTLRLATSTDGTVLFSGILAEGGDGPVVPAPAARQLGDPADDGDKTSIRLEGVGHYRVVSYHVTFVVGMTKEAGILTVGLPLDQVDRTLTQLVGLEIVLAMIVISGSVVAARTLVERSLRPLNRVASTAQQVSQLQLDKGDVATAVRVPESDADPSSEVGRVGRALNHMLNNVDGALAARQASEMKVRQFVADASHELRNPLAAIRGYAELTRRDRADIPPDTAYAMSRVESEADRMSHLVEDLLLLARLDSGPDLDRRPVDLTEVVINAANDARAAGPDHIWTLALPAEPVIAVGDQHRLHQVIANLMANARTHTPPGTIVETGLRVEGDEAVITVTDNGTGVPAEIQGRIFERFTRADVSRVRSDNTATGGSTGLGLAIVAAVVEAHSGRVEMDSRPGRTCFAIRLPLTTTVAPPDPGSPS